MKREARDFRETAPRPVRRIPLEIKNPRLRLLLVIIALVIAAGAFFIAFRGLVEVEPGWTVLEADGAAGLNVSGEFSLQVELGAGGEAPLTERKWLTGIYSAAAREAYTLYTTQEQVENVNNLWYVNHHPGETIQVDPKLYRSLEESLSAGDWLYLGPVYEVWDSVWFSREDREAAAADPRKDPEIREYLEQIMAYIQDGAVRLELLGDRKVRLNLSDELRKFGEENGISRWIDFGWQRNAYVIDDLAEALLSAGWTRAVLSSRDGFIRCLDGQRNFTMNLSAYTGVRTQIIAEAVYTGPAALMMLLPEPAGNRSYSYRYDDGEFRTAWISSEDGLDCRPVDGLAAGTDQGGCAQLLCRFLNLLTDDDASEDEWTTAAEGCALWLARNGSLKSIGNDMLTLIGEGIQ